MTLRKKLIDYPIVTPTTNDYVAGNQGGTVKQFRLSAIYSLFKASYDTVYATITDSVTNSALATALSSKQNVYTDNRQIGVSTVTMNVKTGTARFTAVIIPGATAQLTVNNTSVDPGKRILWSLMYDFAGGGTGQPQPGAYNATGSGVTFYVTNVGVSPTNTNIYITFEVLN